MSNWYMVLLVAEATMKDNAEEDVFKVSLVRGHRPASRILFGPVDHEENGKELIRQLQKMDMMAMQKWNFNFRDCLPLEGSYKWELEKQDKPRSDISAAVSEETDLPEQVASQLSVSRCPVDSRHLCGSETAVEANSQNGLTYSSDTSNRDLLPPADSATTTNHCAALGPLRGRRQRQSTLGKYFRVRRRRPEKVKALKGFN